MNTIFDLLSEVQDRTSLYVGGSTRREQLGNLARALKGYEWALSMHGIKEPGSSFSKNFGSYLQKRFGWSMSAGPFAAILEAAGIDDDEAYWRLFWELVWAYQKTLEDKTEP